MKAGVAVSAAAIAVSVAITAAPAPAPLWDRIPIVEQDNELGRACPLPWGLVTAGHVANLVPGKRQLVEGLRLMNVPAKRHPALDLSLWPLPEGMPAMTPSPAQLTAGLKVQSVGMKYDLSPVIVTAELRGRVGGNGASWVVSDTSGPGSSGSCVVRVDNGEVVGILVGGKPKELGPGFIGVMIPISQAESGNFVEEK
jgi:hypothetical protein